MKGILKFMKRFLYAVLLILLVLAGIAVHLVRRSWPEVSGTIAVSGLTQPVRVLRDNLGIPNIYAANEHDLFFAQGYVHAQDRLWQMELNRLICRGSLSSVFGKSSIESDRYLRTIGIFRAAEEDWALASPETRSYLEAYSAGVNAYIDSLRNKLPIEFLIFRTEAAHWSPVDSIAWSKMMALSMSQNHSVEIARAQLIAKLGSDAAQQLMPPYPDNAAVIIPPAARSYAGFQPTGLAPTPHVAQILGELGQPGGSNSWVIAGSKTETGKPILGNDTHLSLAMPSIWYENGLHAGAFDCVGYSLPGTPLVIIGHNGRIAWGISNMCSDVQDLYVEKLNDAANPTQYQVNGAWETLHILEEKIPVKGQADEPCKILVTRHGPLVHGVYDLKEPVSLRWTALEGGRLIDAVSALDRAKDWSEFRQALSNWDAPSMNFVYADVDGNIGYQATGKIPIRPSDDQGLVPMPGDADRYEWQGYIPFDDLPSVLNPNTGFIVAANNKVVPETYPYHVAYDYGDPYRATRLTQLISASNKVNVKSAEVFQSEVYSLPAEALRPYLLALTPENDLQKKALDQVRSWDLHFTEDSTGAAIYYAWYWFLNPNILSNKLGEDLKDYRGATPMIVQLMSQPNSPWFDDKGTPNVETRDDIVRRSFAEGLEWLTKRLGQDMAQWRWGRLHTVTFVSTPLGKTGIGFVDRLFNSKTLPLAGEAFSVNSSGTSKKRLFSVVFGVSQRLIVDLSDFDKSESVNSTGQSGLPFHRHRDDQVALWRDAKYHSLPFHQKAAEAQAESVLTLTPR